MGRINGSVSQRPDAYEYWIDWSESNVNTTNNTSVVSATVYIKCNSHTSYENNKTSNLTINGQTFSNTLNINLSPGTTVALVSGSVTVGHNNDGSKTINISATSALPNGSGWGPRSGSASANVGLTTIARYANFTSLSVKSKTVNSVTFSFTTDRKANIFCSIDGTTWLNNGNPFIADTTSGTFTVYYKDRGNTQRLDYNKSYTFTFLCRNSQNLLDTSKTLTTSTYDIAKITSAPNVNIGSSHTINWSNPSGTTISLKLCKTDGTQIINYGNVTGTSKAITPTASTIYALIPNSNKITLRYILTTTCNNTNYTNYKDCVFTVTNSNPTFSNFIYQDTNSKTISLTGNNQILIKGYSNVKGTISTGNKATAKNSSTMKNYKMLIGSKSITGNYSSNADVNLTINSIDSNVIDMYAIDSRGNSTKVSKNATIKNYSNIRIVSMQAIRENNIGQTVTLKFEGQFWNASFGSVTNIITSCMYKYKNTSSSTYVNGETTLTYTVSANKITGSVNIKGDLGAEGFDISNSYNIQLILADKLSSTSYTITLGSGNPAIAVYKNNVAIGGKYDTNENSKLQINGDVFLNNQSIIKWKENGYGDKFAIVPSFAGVDDNNQFKIQGSVGSAGTNPSLYDLFRITGKNGNAWCKGFIETPAIKSKLENINGRISDANIAHTYENSRAHVQLIQASASMTSNKPISDGYILHFSWDNSGAYNSQIFINNNNPLRMQARGCNNGTWGNWEDISIFKILYNNTSGTTGTVTLSETSANFNYLEIFYGKTGYANKIIYGNTKIYSPNGKMGNLSLFYRATNTVNQYIYADVTISGTSITKTYYGSMNYSTSGSLGSASISDNSIVIYKVVGYR